MGKIWITSDLHFNHDKEFLYKPRGFDNIKDMMENVIENWNNIITEDDDVYVLGDLMLNDDCQTLALLSKLKGRIHIILGNHDTIRRQELYTHLSNVVELCYAKPLKYRGFHF